MGFNETVVLNPGSNRTTVNANLIDDNAFEYLYESYQIQMELAEEPAMIRVAIDLANSTMLILDNESWLL